MKCNWEDLPKPLSCFTVRNATMVNLNTGKIVSNYAANTKIVVVQKCVTEKGTYYRTNEATHNYLNYAFKASDFGLPNEVAPSAPSVSFPPNSLSSKKPKTRTHQSAKKQTSSKKAVSSKGGEGRQPFRWFKKFFGRKHGKTKNS